MACERRHLFFGFESGSNSYRGAHGVEPICKVLPIAPSTYHAHVAKWRDPAKLSARTASGSVVEQWVSFLRFSP
jgi:hypothetical protein